MSDLLDRLPEEAREAVTDEPFPDWVDPMLATLSDEPFSDPDWIFERKLDGERCLAFARGDRVRLLSRNRKDITDSYPEPAEALIGVHPDALVVDGEVVAFSGNRTSFARLQPRMQIDDPEEARRSGVAVFYYLFDLLHIDGRCTRDLALRDRKRLLKHALSFRDPLRFLPHRNAEGEPYHREACRRGWEGVIGKRADAPYRGGRSRRWLKLKCVHEQELVIGGFTEPEGERVGLGAILVGHYEDDRLVYAGKVGTGFDEETLRDLRRRLERRERDTPPFDAPDLSESGVHWTTPELVAQVGLTEWTEDGKLRHPRFLGLRRDKDPREVRRERP